MKGEGSNWVCVGVLKGERGVFGGKGVWRCGGKSKRKKRERDEKMREKVDEISNESVWRVSV